MDKSQYQFQLVSKKVGSTNWVRYDGYGDRYSVCITQYSSGYRHIDIFSPLKPQSEPDIAMYIVENDVTPVDVRIEIPAVSLMGKQGLDIWTRFKEEVAIAIFAAQEIKERFVIAKEDESIGFCVATTQTESEAGHRI